MHVYVSVLLVCASNDLVFLNPIGGMYCRRLQDWLEAVSLQPIALRGLPKLIHVS